MKSTKVACVLVLASALGAGCNGDGSDSNDPTPVSGLHNGTTLPPLTGSNVLSLTVNGSECSAGSYDNKPCVSVTVCTPGTTTCQTVSDILLDTGSYGLRIFKSALNGLSLPQETIGGSSVAECVEFGDGSSDWGPVQTASVVLGGEPAVSVPIQVIDSTFFSAGNGACGTPEADSSKSFNGILGVGLFVEDCGTNCANSASIGQYFGCSNSSCSGLKVPTAQQVQDPVGSLPVDSNGVVVELPSVPTGGVEYANGYLVLGIGTQSNNTPSQVTEYSADSSGQFTTAFNGSTSESFLDTGSNAYYFSGGNLPDCGLTNISMLGWYCPGSTTSLSATNIASTGSAASTVDFEVGNLISLSQSGNSVFVEMAGSSGSGIGGLFDWGLPFYLGRNVYVGFSGSVSTLGTGPYWAY